MFVDSHCHLDMPGLAERLPEVLAAMATARVETALCISVNLQDFPRVLALAETYHHLWASVGVHPEHTVASADEPTIDTLCQLAAHPRVIAIGETGLDYHWHPERPEWQRQRFRTHIQAARQCHKPLIIHTREAAADTLLLMREEGADKVGGVMHCFTESLEVAEAAMALGFYISFSGIVTFKNAMSIKEVAQTIPLSRMLIETDSPYLAPHPHRGKTNEPAYVSLVAAEIARLRGITVEEVATVTTENFYRLFGVGCP